MKVKYLFNDGELEFEGIYNVFAIQDEGEDGKKIYLSDFNIAGSYYITSYPFDAFEIVDTKISKFWECGVNQFGDLCLGIPEIFLERNFWERYYDDNYDIQKILDLYYKVGEDKLFNKPKL